MRIFTTTIFLLFFAIANAANDTIPVATRINDGREKYGDFIPLSCRIFGLRAVS